MRIRCFKLIMAMKVEYEAAHGRGTTQQYTHKNTMSADSSVSKKPLYPLLYTPPLLVLSLQKSSDRSPNMRLRIVTESRRKTVGSVPASQGLTITLSPLSHLSTQSAKTQKEREGGKKGKASTKAAVIVTEKAEKKRI